MFDIFDLLQLLSARRFAAPFLISIGIAIGMYYLTGQEPSSAAMALSGSAMRLP